VPGEYEVLGQVRRALERATEEGTAGPELIELFQRAVAAGRRARHETSVARGTTSFATATVDLVRHDLGGSLAGVHAVVLGAGQLAAGVARSLRDDAAVASIVVANRTTSRAETLVRDLDDARARAISLENVMAAVSAATVVVAALEAPSPVLTRAGVADRTAPLLIIDLGVPRVVASDVGDIPGVRRLDLSVLRAVIEQTLQDRRESLDAAATIVADEADRWHDDRRTRGAATIVRALRDRFETLRLQELARSRGELATLSDTDREAVDALTRALVAKLLHTPTVALKDASGTDQGHRLTDATRTLFDL
jgi:glutamyl-tRNA reductase